MPPVPKPKPKTSPDLPSTQADPVAGQIRQALGRLRLKTPGMPAPPPPPGEPPPVATFAEHCQRWRDGCGSVYCPKATKVFARGKIPCDLLFLGEAPGLSENAIGSPFVGPAGKLQDAMIARALADVNATHLRVLFANLVMCVPLDESGDKTTEPEDEQIIACSGRLQELVRLADPKVLVCVGKHARDFTEPGLRVRIKFHYDYVDRPDPTAGQRRRVCVKHPAALLRMNVAQKGLEVQRYVAAVADAAEGLL